jgi:2-keto-4-pentenoate hydratase
MFSKGRTAVSCLWVSSRKVSKFSKAAQIIVDAQANHPNQAIDQLPEDCIPSSFEEAYQLQAEVATFSGNIIGGFKVGATSQEIMVGKFKSTSPTSQGQICAKNSLFRTNIIFLNHFLVEFMKKIL